MTFSSHKFVIVGHHGEALGGVLPDEGVDNAERLTRARCSEDDSSTKWIDYVHPSFTKFAFIVVAHGDVDRVVVTHQILRLLKALVLEVKAVFQQSLF